MVMRRRLRRRGPRRRTRWVAFTPHAIGPFTTNDSYDQQLMEIEDATNLLVWSDFIGATVLRTIVDFVMDPIPGQFNGSAATEVQQILHLGVFMDEAAAPEQSRWDPNVPHGDFMWRQTWAHTMIVRVGGNSNDVAFNLHDGVVVRLDSTVKRRVTEDLRMWVAGHYFERLGGLLAEGSLAVGYTGRVLLALP